MKFNALTKVFSLALATTAAATAAVSAHATISSYNVTETFYEPDTQPSNSVFVGTFDYDATTRTITNLKGQLSEAMTGGSSGYPNDTMTWLSLSYQLVSWYDAALGGTFAAAFKNNSTNTFWTGAGGDGWSPASGVSAGGVYYGFPKSTNNPGNAYALIFVPDSPLTALTQAQLDKLAYADCSAGGMMGAVCMTGTSLAGYGSTGTMSGYPLSQVITASVPEPSSALLTLAGLAVGGLVSRRRSRSATAS